MNERIFPYENLSLDDMPGERWQSITGFEGYYEISTFGRVKSIQRERVLHHGGLMPLPAKIRRQHLSKVSNHTVGDYLFSLNVTLFLEGVKYYFSVGRLVYNAFIERFYLKNKSIFISFKDGEGRNLHYENLAMTNLSELRNKSYAQGRSESSLRKPVSQFDVKGNLISQYPSMYAAGRQNGIGERAIAGAAAHGATIYKGFIWQTGLAKRLKKNTLPKRLDQENPVTVTGKQEDIDIQKPSLSLSGKNHPGERWKDIPGYESLYRVSNYGRVKALAKISEGKVQRWYPERIKKLSPSYAKLKDGSIHYSSLALTLCRNHRKATCYISRLVYFLFVKQFDIDNRALRIYTKDGDPTNAHYKNLMLKNAAWSINGKKPSI